MNYIKFSVTLKECNIGQEIEYLLYNIIENKQ